MFFLLFVSVDLHGRPKSAVFEIKTIRKQLETEGDIAKRVELSQRLARVYYSSYRDFEDGEIEKIIAEGFFFCNQLKKVADCRKKFADHLGASAGSSKFSLVIERIQMLSAAGATTELNGVYKKILFFRKNNMKAEDFVKAGLFYISELLMQVNVRQAAAIFSFLEKNYSKTLESESYKNWVKSLKKVVLFNQGKNKEALALSPPPLEASVCKASGFDAEKGSRVYTIALDYLMAGDHKKALPFAENCYRSYSSLIANRNSESYSAWMSLNVGMMFTMNNRFSQADELFEDFRSRLKAGEFVKQAWLQIGRACRLYKSGNKAKAVNTLVILQQKMKTQKNIYGKEFLKFLTSIVNALNGKKADLSTGNHLRYCFQQAKN